MEIERSKRLSDIGVLASTIAHEMRNPLAAIKTAAYNIGRKAAHSLIEPHLATINNKVFESDLIIQNLLSFSCSKKPQLEKVRLALLLNECVESIRSKYAKWNVIFTEKLHCENTLTINADPTQLKILFSNLLDNAFQSLEHNTGKVTIETNIVQRSISIEIRDTGTGIDPEDILSIFEPFFTRKSKGTGLGLTISKQIVDLHNGKITVVSTKGSGTTISILLPK